jgi:hypothetical protein
MINGLFGQLGTTLARNGLLVRWLADSHRFSAPCVAPGFHADLVRRFARSVFACMAQGYNDVNRPLSAGWCILFKLESRRRLGFMS